MTCRIFWSSVHSPVMQSLYCRQSDILIDGTRTRNVIAIEVCNLSHIHYYHGAVLRLYAGTETEC